MTGNTNDFKAFATGASANVISQADYEALTELVTGFTAGKASSAQVNKALRQATFIAAALAQYVADTKNTDVLDDGDLSTFVTTLTEALNASAGSMLNSANTWSALQTFSAGMSGDLQGNASTATKLQTARYINGVPFDGTSDITISSGMSQSTADTRYVQNVRLGSETSVLMPFGGKVGIGGHVITALSIAGEVDNSGDFAYFRPVQISINGAWATVSQL